MTFLYPLSFWIEILLLHVNRYFCCLTGRHLCTLPLDPNIGKMLLMGSIFQCLNPALTIAAALAHRDPFVLPLNRKEEADAAKRSFAGDSCRLACTRDSQFILSNRVTITLFFATYFTDVKISCI